MQPPQSSLAAHATSPESDLGLGEIESRVCSVSRQWEDERGAAVVIEAIMLIAGEIQSSIEHGVERELLAPNLAELVCKAAHLAALQRVDLVAATAECLRREESRRETARPGLRSV